MPTVFNILIKSETHSCFTDTRYKRGTVVETFSNTYIPQSIMYGVLTQALMMLLGDGDTVKEVLTHVHLTTPLPVCTRHPWHTFWLEPNIPICGKCGRRAVAKRTKIFLTAPLNPHLWQPITEEGEPIRRQYPRRIYALSPDQYFKFHLIVDEDEYLDYINKCFKIIFHKISELDICRRRVGMEYGIGLSMGWGKKFGWGLFSAEIQKIPVKYEKLDKYVYTAIAQAPVKEGYGVELLSGMYENVRYISNRNISSLLRGAEFTSEIVIAKGSVVKIDANKVNLLRYTIDMDGFTFILLHERGDRGIFTRTIRYGQRTIVDQVKAIEPIYMLAW